jgi:hypothetical protein
MLAVHMNTLYYGDNLDILRNPEYIRPESVDLIYLDPPIAAFDGTWHCFLAGEETLRAFRSLRENKALRLRTLGAT